MSGILSPVYAFAGLVGALFFAMEAAILTAAAFSAHQDAAVTVIFGASAVGALALAMMCLRVAFKRRRRGR